MRKGTTILKVGAWAATALSVLLPALSAQEAPPAAAAPGLETKQPGEVITVGGLALTVKEMAGLPVVENDYSRRFLYDRWDNPKLKTLRENEKLTAVVAPGQTEFEQQLRLMHWTYQRFKKFGQPDAKVNGTLEILKAVDEGHTFYCAHYAAVLVSAAASLGWVDRAIGLRVGNRTLGPAGQGYTEHSTTEIWSNQYGKWIMFDPTFDVYVAKAGVPLNAWEIRQEWFYGDPHTLDFVVGEQNRHYSIKDLPLRRPHPGSTGNFPLEHRTFDVYAHLMFETRTNPMDAPSEAKDRPAFIVKDTLAEGVKWHTRDNPKDPAHEAYFPLGQAALRLVPAEGQPPKLMVGVDTMTPNFACYRYRFDGGPWVEGSGTGGVSAGAKDPTPGATGEKAPRGPSLRIEWPLHAGLNSLEAKAVNRFGVEGKPGRVVLEAPQ